MVQAYWHVGGLIVEEDQRGQERAEYGKQQLKRLSERLQADFSKGFDVGNLRNMRQFYLTFPKHYALSSVLSWTHYRVLMRLENAAAREWYAQETDLEQAIIGNLQQFNSSDWPPIWKMLKGASTPGNAPLRLAHNGHQPTRY